MKWQDLRPAQILNLGYPPMPRVWPIVLAVVIVALAGWSVNRYAFSDVRVTVAVDAPAQGTLEVFWSAVGEPFSPMRSRRAALPSGAHSIAFSLPAVASSGFRLRVDPMLDAAAVTLSSITVARPGFDDLVLTFPADAGRLERYHIARVETAPDGTRLVFDGVDPNFSIHAQQSPRWSARLMSAGIVALVSAVLWLLCWAGGCVDGRGRTAVFAFVAAAVSTVYGLSEAPFGDVLIKDAYTYIEKAFEITEGNWSLQDRKSIGWPVLQAGLIQLLGIRDYFSAMTMTRLLCIVLVAAAALPVYLLGRQAAGPLVGALAAVFMIAHPKFIDSSHLGFAEPLYMLVVYTALVFLLRSGGRGAALWIGVFLAAAAFYVRPQGLFMIPFFVLFFLAVDMSWQERRRMIVATLVVFVALSAPHLVARTVQFGSPLDYGDNSKYLVDTYEQVYAPNIESPTIFEFFARSGWPGIYEKFVANGLFSLAEKFAAGMGMGWFLLAVGTSIASFLVDSLRRLRPLVVYCAVFFFALVPVWDVYQDARFFYAIMPATLIVAAGGALWLLERARLRLAAFAGAAAIIVASVAFGGQRVDFDFYENVSEPAPLPGWAKWAGEHLYGEVAMIDELNLVQMAAGERARNLDRRKRLGEEHWIDPFRPGIYSSLDEAMGECRARGVRFVITDSVQNHRRPYFDEIAGRIGRDVELLRAFRYPHAELGTRVVAVYAIKVAEDDDRRP